MENRAHNLEPLEKRIKRFQNGSPVEIIETLLNSIANFFNNEIRLTTEDDHYQTSLMFLGIHAVALTISEGFFNKSGPEGYKLFLEKFVDGDTSDTRFSQVAESIHNWRNILAHQWLGIGGYDIGYDYTSALGWEKRDDTIFINPKIYCEHYLNAFSSNGRLWDYQDVFTKEELYQVKERLLGKFLSH
ncbi:MAG: hypothetical protein WC842_00170 [Candidatus Paceibacterota bacterium]|jgi:hypothetical protein